MILFKQFNKEDGQKSKFNSVALVELIFDNVFLRRKLRSGSVVIGTAAWQAISQLACHAFLLKKNAVANGFQQHLCVLRVIERYGNYVMDVIAGFRRRGDNLLKTSFHWSSSSSSLQRSSFSSSSSVSSSAAGVRHRLVGQITRLITRRCLP